MGPALPYSRRISYRSGSARSAAKPSGSESVGQHRRLSNMAGMIGLPNQEIGDVGARYQAVAPALGVFQNPIAAGMGAVGQNDRPDDGPVKLAFLDQAFLDRFVVVGAPQQEPKGNARKAVHAFAAAPSAKSGHGDQACDFCLLHRCHKAMRSLRKETNRTRYQGRPQGKAQGLDDGVDPLQRRLKIIGIKRIALTLFQTRSVQIDPVRRACEGPYAVTGRQSPFHGLAPDPAAGPYNQQMGHALRVPAKR